LAISVLFPAFAVEYSGTEEGAISVFENNFRNLIETASHILESDLSGFDFLKNNFLDDELKSQYISYIYSCSVADILRNEKIDTSFISGYSMGIYASLYYCRSISFIDGIKLIKYAWETISGLTREGKYGMGMVIGLEQSDIEKYLKPISEVEICNQNNPYTFIISGKLSGIEKVLGLAKEEGALRTNLLPVSKPYHSELLKQTAPEFTRLISNILFSVPEYNYISAMDQKVITTGEGLRNEVIENLSCRMSWIETMKKMIALGTDTFFECGAGESLTRNLRFIEGAQKSFSVGKLDKFLEAGRPKSEDRSNHW
jgi:[acyl-carrier-protein] S-malonyltransferase